MPGSANVWGIWIHQIIDLRNLDSLYYGLEEFGITGLLTWGIWIHRIIDLRNLDSPDYWFEGFGFTGLLIWGILIHPIIDLCANAELCLNANPTLIGWRKWILLVNDWIKLACHDSSLDSNDGHVTIQEDDADDEVMTTLVIFMIITHLFITIASPSALLHHLGALNLHQ